MNPSPPSFPKLASQQRPSVLHSPFRCKMSFLASSDPMDTRIPLSISKLFRTNSVPSSMDVPHIRQLLSEHTAKLSAFAREIERVRAEAHRLEQQRDQVSLLVRELEALLSPVRRMPTDIMAKVFEHCVWDQDLPKADPRTAPLLLSHVCRSWRHLLFSLPCLWTTLHLDLPLGAKNWDALVQSRTLAMHTWFARSAALPVSLFFNHPKGSLMPWHALSHLDKDILILSSRLKNLSLHFSARSLTCLLTFTQSPLPHLQHLQLQNSNSLPTNETPPPIVLHSAPSLKSLCISWCSLDLRDFQIPWAQLQHLNLEYDASSFWNPVHSDYLETLALCPNLTTLYLGIGSPINDPDLPHIHPVTLARVHTFKSCIFTHSPYLVQFFDALRLPQLRHFEVKNVSLAFGSVTGDTEFLPLLARCADTLESVSLIRVDIADPLVLSCLAQLHHLKTMSFLPGVLRLNHGLVTALTHDDAGARVCPVLETLRLRCSSVVSIDAITRLVASRCQREPKLKQFLLEMASFDYGLDARDERIAQVRAQLNEYVEAGLQLVLTKSSTISGCDLLNGS